MPESYEPHGMSHIPTGVPGLDEILGGGLPEYSFSLVAGGPGAGKTTLVQQILFRNATPERPAVFFTVLGEPTVKLLRHQQQYTFFSIPRVGVDVHYINLTDLVGGGLDRFLEVIVEHVERLKPAFVAVDSFRSVLRAREEAHPVDLERFVQRLAILLTTWEVTSFLVGEYVDEELSNPVFTVADVILKLDQAIDRNSVVRKLQVVKTRGQEAMPGLHTFRINDHGLQTFPRIPITRREDADRHATRLSTGVPGLDALMGGGVPKGDVVLIAGPTGAGKTTFAMQFVLDGLQRGESAVVAGFEEHPREYVTRARTLGGETFDRAKAEGRFEVMYLRPLDLSVDETMYELQQAVLRTGATRVVIDSLSGFEVALAPTFRVDFRESLYRLLSVMTSLGVTVALTNEVNDGERDQHYTRYGVSFLCDDILLIRYVEIDGEHRRILTVLKMRSARHSRAIHAFETTARGIEVGLPLTEYTGLMNGTARLTRREAQSFHGLTAQEVRVGHALNRAGRASLAELGTATGIDGPTLEAALIRLTQLEYAVLLEDERGQSYAILSRMLP